MSICLGIRLFSFVVFSWFCGYGKLLLQFYCVDGKQIRNNDENIKSGKYQIDDDSIKRPLSSQVVPVVNLIWFREERHQHEMMMISKRSRSIILHLYFV